MHSLRARLLILFALLAVGPLLIVGVFDYVRSRQLVESLLAAQTDTIASRAAASINQRYAIVGSDILLLTRNAQVQALISAMSGRDTTRVAAAREAANQYLDEVWALTRATYHAVQIRGAGGDLLYARDDGAGTDASGQPAIQVPFTDAAGAVQGSLLLVPKLDEVLPNETMGLKFGRSGFSAVVDRRAGRIVRHSDAAMVLRPTRSMFDSSSWAADSSRLADGAGTLVYTDKDSLRVASFGALRFPAWTVVSSAAVGEFADVFGRQRRADLAFLLALAGAVALAFLWQVTRATHSLRELRLAADAVGRGDLSPELPHAGRDEVGALSRAFGNMTERIRAMVREIEVSRQLAVLGEFAAQLSHEVRNPLTSIKLDLQGLQRQSRAGALPSSAAAPIDTCLTQVNRLEAVVGGVLELARVPRKEHERVDVHAVLRQAIDGLSSQFTSQGLVVDCPLAASRHSVEGDPNALVGLFVNLLLNAAQAQPAGGRVGVTTGSRSAVSGDAEQGTAQGWIDVVIADDGPGIPDDRRDEIFRPFHTTRRGGTGLGLPLALRTARACGGSIALADPPAGYRGAAFVVSLPLA